MLKLVNFPIGGKRSKLLKSESNLISLEPDNCYVCFFVFIAQNTLRLESPSFKENTEWEKYSSAVRQDSFSHPFYSDSLMIKIDTIYSKKYIAFFDTVEREFLEKGYFLYPVDICFGLLSADSRRYGYSNLKQWMCSETDLTRKGKEYFSLLKKIHEGKELKLFTSFYMLHT